MNDQDPIRGGQGRDERDIVRDAAALAGLIALALLALLGWAILNL